MAANQVISSDKSILASLQNCNATKKIKFKLGFTVRIRRKKDLSHRVYRIQLTEEVLQIAVVETPNPHLFNQRLQYSVDSRRILRERASSIRERQQAEHPILRYKVKNETTAKFHQ